MRGERQWYDETEKRHLHVQLIDFEHVETNAFHVTWEWKIKPPARKGEILDWLRQAGRENEPWLALDAAAWQFQRHRDRLIACTWYVGFDDTAEAMLRALLAR